MSNGSSAGGGVELAGWPGTDFSGVPLSHLAGLIGASDARTATENECVGGAAVCEQGIRYLQASQARFLARACGQATPRVTSRHGLTGAELTAAEIAPMFGLSRGQARARVELARSLVADLPRVLNLLEKGLIGLQHAEAVGDELRKVLDPDNPLRPRVENDLTGTLPGRTSRQARNDTRQRIDAGDPAAAARRAAAARADRKVTAYPLADGMGAVTAQLTADTTRLVDQILDALADGCRDHSRAAGTPDPRTHQQRRADAFSTVFTAIGHGTPLPLLPADPQTPRPGAAGSSEKASPGTGSPSNCSRGPSEPESAGTEADPRDETGTGTGSARDVTTSPFSAPDQVDEPRRHADPDRLTDLDWFARTVRPVAAAGPADPADEPNCRSASSGLPGVLGWWLPPALPTQQGRRPHLMLTMSASTLNGEDEMPAELHGYGPVPAPLAREMAAQAGKRTTVILPVGIHPSEAAPPVPPKPPGTSAPAKARAQNPRGATGKGAPGEKATARPAHTSAGRSTDGNTSTGAAPRDTTSETWTMDQHGPGDQARCRSQDRPYRPAQSLLDEVTGLHQTCRHPGCQRPAE